MGKDRGGEIMPGAKRLGEYTGRQVTEGVPLQAEGKGWV